MNMSYSLKYFRASQYLIILDLLCALLNNALYTALLSGTPVTFHFT